MTARPEDYTVGWICAISTEFVVACELLDEEYGRDRIPKAYTQRDKNSYKFGRIHEHNVVIACLPKGCYGTTSAATVAEHMLSSFPAIRFGLMVGIAGGAPSQKHDVRLGDVVVSSPTPKHGGVLQYDFGKAMENHEFEETGRLPPPPDVLLTALSNIETQHIRRGHKIKKAVTDMLEKNENLRVRYSPPSAESDRLYESSWFGQDREIIRPERQLGKSPVVHYGLIASANRVMKDRKARNALMAKHDVLCFEMEAAGLMNNFPCLVIRGICDYSDARKNDDWQGYAAATAAAYARELLEIIPGKEIESIQIIEEASKQQQYLYKDQQRELELRQGFIDDLYNQTLESRTRQIPEAADGTYEWIFDSSTAEDIFNLQTLSTGFSKWLCNGHGIYWITGKPGSGKSTLIKFIVQHPKTKANLQEWAGSGKVSTASFYFWVSGAPLQRSLIGLLQSIFYQILDYDRDLIEELFPREWRRTKESKRIEWTEDSFMDAVDQLKDIRKHRQHKFCFFIDGLDEYRGEKDHEWLCRFLLKLCSLPRIKLCVSSRYWAVFQSAFSSHPNLKLHEWTRCDIDKFVHQELKAHSLWTELRNTELNRADHLVNKISEEAAGVFLWVFLTVRSLIKGLEKGDNMEQLEATLDVMPKTLHEFFDRIIGDLPEDDHDFAIKALLMVKIQKFLGRSLPPVIMFSFLKEPFEQGAPCCAISLHNLKGICTRTKRRLNAVCGDLLVVNEHYDWKFCKLGAAYDSSVSFAHRTISDYLDSPAGSTLLLLRNGSKLDARAWYIEALLSSCKIFPTRVSISAIFETLRKLYGMWEAYLLVFGSTSPHLRYIEELDKAFSIAFEAIPNEEGHWTWALWDYSTFVKPSSLLEFAACEPALNEYFRAKLQSPESLPNTQDFSGLFDCALWVHVNSCSMYPDTLIDWAASSSKSSLRQKKALELIQRASFKLFQNGSRPDYLLLEATMLLNSQESSDYAFNLVKCEHSGKRSVVKTYRSCKRMTL